MSISAPKNERDCTVSDKLSRDTIFDALSNQRRRHTLHYLAQNEGIVDLRELSEQLAAWEYGIPRRQVNWEQRKNVYTALQQVHLPRMDDMGIVDFDDNRGKIDLQDDVKDLQLYLDFVPKNDIPWNKYYLGLSVLSGCVIAFAAGGLVPFSSIPTVAWAGFIVALFGISAVVHTYHNKQIRLGREGPPIEYAGGGK